MPQDDPFSAADAARRAAQPFDFATATGMSDGALGVAPLSAAAEAARLVADHASTSKSMRDAFVALDPLADAKQAFGTTIGHAHEQALREAGLVGQALHTSFGEQIGAGFMGRTMAEAARGSVADQVLRDLAEHDRRMADLFIGRTPGGETLSLIARAERDALARTCGTASTSGSLVAEAMERAYTKLGIGAAREELLGYASSFGSLAPIAAGLLRPSDAIAVRTEALLLDLERERLAGSGLGQIDGALRAGYGDIFGTMRTARPLEIEAVLAGLTSVEALKPYPDWAAEARARFESYQTPWVRTDLPDASILGMTRLAELDLLVARRAPGGADVNDLLRDRLGDYADAPAPAPKALADPVARTAYQLERGLDPALTLLPTAIVAAVFAPFGERDPQVPVDPDEIENVVRMLLKRLETALRQFIAGRLRSLYGDDWFASLPSDMRRAWTKARDKEAEAGRRPGELIDYADMDDYLKIIEHPERWPRLFEPVFRDQGQIRATLRRIAVIRNTGAHFRAVTVEDLLVLRGEGVHLARWLGVRLGG